ncbi:hypothetical protein HMPREF1576_01389, partial [Gardnerella pickettii JCP7719]
MEQTDALCTKFDLNHVHFRETTQTSKNAKTLPPVDGRVLLKYNLLGVRRANCFAIHATAEVTAGWA